MIKKERKINFCKDFDTETIAYSKIKGGCI